MAARSVLVYGGSGALGRVMVTEFKKAGWNVTSIDLGPNDDAHHNVVLNVSSSWEEQGAAAAAGVASVATKFSSIVCVAGGWAGGNASSPDLIKNSELMWKQSVQSSTIAAALATQHLAEGGLLLLTGALAATKGTPGMIGYGMAKAAVHQLVKSLAEAGSGMPANSRVAAILPVTLDTPGNRKWAGPDTDFGFWTPMDQLAQETVRWSTDAGTLASGSLLSVVTKGGQTAYTPI